MEIRALEISDIIITEEEAIELLIYNSVDEFNMLRSVAKKVDSNSRTITSTISLSRQDCTMDKDDCEYDLLKISELAEYLEKMKKSLNIKLEELSKQKG